MVFPQDQGRDNRQYVAFVLQCLFACNSFRKAVLENRISKEHPLIHSLQHVFKGMKQESSEPKEFIRIYEAHYCKANSLEDCVKFTKTLLKVFCEEGERHIFDALSGKKNVTLDCKFCRKRPEFNQTVSYLTITVTEANSLLSEVLTRLKNKQESNSSCPHCHHMVDMTEELLELPDVLVLVIQYASTTGFYTENRKIEERMNLAGVLPLSQRSLNKGHIYYLKGVVFEHSVGHNTALVKSSEETSSSAAWVYYRGGNHLNKSFANLESFEKNFRKTSGKPVVLFYARNEESTSRTHGQTTAEVQMKTSSAALKTRMSFTNTSAITSVLQSLFMCTRFRKTILDFDANKDMEAVYPMMCSLQKLFKKLQTSRDAPFREDEIHELAARVNTSESDFHESSEFLRMLLSHVLGEGFPVQKGLFFGELSRYILCLQCRKKEDVQTEICSDVILALPNNDRYPSISSSILSLLSVYFEQRTLDGENKYFCKRCKKQTQAEMNLKIKELPQYLVLTLPRFFIDGGIEWKNNVQVTCDRVINLAEFCDRSETTHEYNVAAVISHSGSHVSYGTHRCYAPNENLTESLRQNSAWFSFRDHSNVSSEYFNTSYENPVLVIYERKHGNGSPGADEKHGRTDEAVVEADDMSSHENISYIECAVQALYMCSSFRHQVLSCILRGDTDHQALTPVLRKAFQKYESANREPLCSNELVRLVPQSKTSQDVDKDCAALLRAWLIKLKDERYFELEGLLTGVLLRHIRHCSCDTGTTPKEEPFTDLILTIPSQNSGNLSISELISEYFKVSNFEGENGECLKCGEPRNGRIHVKVKMLPQYLILALTHFEFDPAGSILHRKNIARVTCDWDLDFSGFFHQSASAKAQYKLITIITHCGQYSYSEEYKCYSSSESEPGVTMKTRSKRKKLHDLNAYLEHSESASHRTSQDQDETPVVLIYERIQSTTKENLQGPKEGHSSETRMTHTHYKTGLSNLGNTCYMNSAVQALFMCQGFQEAILQCTPSYKQKIMPKIQNLFLELKDSNVASFSPREFLHVSQPKWFTYGAQHDSSEYLRYLLDKLSDEGMQNATKLFTGEMVRNVTCKFCQETSQGTPEAFTDLMLHIPDSLSQHNVNGLLRHYLRSCTLKGDDRYHCDKCNRLREAILTIQLTDLPPFLTLTILRFEQGQSSVAGKNMTAISCDREIEVQHQSESNPVVYKLNAVIVHCGYFASSGHYMCYARNMQETHQNPCNVEDSTSRDSTAESPWYCYDDSNVRPVDSPSFEGYGMTPVVLIYKKHPESPLKSISKSKQKTEKLLAGRNNQSKPSAKTALGSGSQHSTYTETIKLPSQNTFNTSNARCQVKETTKKVDLPKLQMTRSTVSRQPLSGRCEDKPVHDIVNETVELLKKK